MMDWISLLMLSFALAADAFSVAVTAGMTHMKARPAQVCKMALCFGIFQFVMPYLGAFLGTYLERFMSAYSDYISFVLLVFIGGKMIYDVLSSPEEAIENPFGFKTLMLLGIATSIDAFAAGISLVTLSIGFFVCAAVIGITAFACSFAGVYLGKRAGALVGDKAGIAGGIILILIGLKIFIFHFI